LGAVDLRPVDMAPRVRRHRVLGPLPVFQRLRVELELARGRGKARGGRPAPPAPPAAPPLAPTLVTGSTVAPSRSAADSGFSCDAYTPASTRKAPYFRMWASGVSPSSWAAAGRPGTLCSKIQR